MKKSSQHLVKDPSKNTSEKFVYNLLFYIKNLING